jgi:hypothetical protein
MELWHKEYGTVYLRSQWQNTITSIRYGAFETAIYGNFVCLPLNEVAVIMSNNGETL